MTDPLWTDEDRGWLMALRLERANTCPGCGHPADECRDRRTEKQWTVETSICQACLVVEATQDNQRENGAKPPRGQYMAAVRTGR